MPKNPLSRVTPVHHGQRNAFDLSRKALFTANIGQLTPFFVQEVQPGDHFEISENSFTRTQNCNSAAYVRLNEYREFFFVPYRLLWSYWTDFITQINDRNSSLLDTATSGVIPSTVPQFSYRTLLSAFLFNGDSSASYIGDQKDLGGFYYSMNFLRLFNMLGYGMPRVFYTEDSVGSRKVDTTRIENVTENIYGSDDYQLNPFRILAYQKIYADHFRPADWEKNNVYSYNIDFPQPTPNGVINFDPDTLTNIWTLHYRPYKRDYFTGVRPSEYWYGSRLDNSINSGIANEYLTGLPSAFENYFSAPFISDGAYLQTDYHALTDNVVNGIRVAYALDKYLRTTLRAGKHYDEQILAHFGVKVPNAITTESSRIGSFVTPLMIDSVTSTADTSGSGGAAVGQIFGQGFADGTKESETIKFDASEHGIIMGIYSVGIESDYSAYGIDPFNIKRTRADYYQPEFDELGPHMLAPEISDIRILSSEEGSTDRTAYTGFIDPYLEYKVPFDKVYGDFMLGGNLRMWTASRVMGSGAYHEFPRPSSIKAGVALSDLFIDPRVMDNVFAISAPKADQLFVNDFTRCSAMRNMSLHGTPKL